MKTFCILSGAYVNAGDFLIVKRTKEILKHIYPDCHFQEIARNKSLTPYLEKINQSDALIIAGGPAYLPNVYPNTLPLVDDLSQIKTKIIPVGLGWYGEEINEQYIYTKYKFTTKTKDLLKRLESDAHSLSCRDYFSCRVLHANDFEHITFTGCPAWYDVQYLAKADAKALKKTTIKKICVSDPAIAQNTKQLKLLIQYLRDKFHQAQIAVVFHRQEQDAGYRKMEQELASQYGDQVKCHNISYSAEGFSIYDECDLHVGFRVHAHIYNLSHRNLSLLIEEDGRGAGVNEALGLPRITAYHLYKKQENSVRKLSNRVRYKLLKEKYYPLNEFFIDDLDAWIHILEQDSVNIYKNAYAKMICSYKNMEAFIKGAIGEE